MVGNEVERERDKFIIEIIKNDWINNSEMVLSRQRYKQSFVHLSQAFDEFEILPKKTKTFKFLHKIGKMTFSNSTLAQN